MTDKTTIMFDIEELTLGDLEFLQDQHGLDVFDQLMKFGSKSEDGATNIPTKLLIDFVWRILLHSDPNATIDDARTVRIADIADDDADDEVDPQSPAES